MDKIIEESNLDQATRTIDLRIKYPGAVPRVGSAVIVESDGKVLLGIRQKDPGRGDLIIPGGGVKPFETIKDAGIREIRAETGLDVKITGRVGCYELIDRNTNTHKVIIYSKAKVITGTLRAATDVSDVKFYSREELKQAPVKGLIKEVLEDAGWLETLELY